MACFATVRFSPFLFMSCEPLPNSLVFFLAFRLGIPSRLVIFPDENHWVLNHGNSLKWHYEVFRWFDKYVGEKKAA